MPEAKDILSQLRNSPKQRADLLRQVPIQEQGNMLLRLSRRMQRDVINKLSNDEIFMLIDHIAPHDTTDLLQLLPQSRAKKITEMLQADIREKVEFLLRFSPQTAAGLMSLEYIVMPSDSTIETISECLQTHEKQTGKFPTILITSDSKLLGELPGHALALSNKKEIIATHLKKVPQLKYDADSQIVIQTFLDHPHDKVVVLNDNGSVLGIIHSDDILQYINKRSGHQLYQLAGVNREEDALDTVITKVRFRYKWLIINMGTAFLAASVVGLFEGTISKIVILAAYMPIVAGMGGNAGTQALAVAIRGLALKEIDLKTSARLIRNEMAAGAINGLIIGSLVGVIALILNQNPLLGLVLGIAMVCNLVIAGLFGSFVPVFLKSLGKDPASSAAVFITTATDVCGFMTFLGLATLLMG